MCSRRCCARRTPAKAGTGRAAALVEGLLAASAEVAAVWHAHDVGARHTNLKRVRHPELGVLELHCQTLVDPDQSQALLVFTAVPGSRSAERLALLRVIAQ